jgi:hypothetical protein
MFARFSRCQTSVIRKKQLERNSLIFCLVVGALASLPRRAAELLPWRKPKLFYYVRVEDIPDKLVPANVYLAGEDRSLGRRDAVPVRLQGCHRIESADAGPPLLEGSTTSPTGQ